MSLAVVYCRAAIGVQAPLFITKKHIFKYLSFIGHEKNIPKKGNASLTRIAVFPIMGKWL